MVKIIGLSHDEVLWFLIQVGILLAVARLLGELCRKIGQPAVLGEIGAGILLGPSFTGLFWPEVTNLLLPQTSGQQHAFDAFTLLGVMFLLLVTGLEIDFGLVKRYARTAVGTAVGGLVLPLVAGFVLALYLPTSFRGPTANPTVFALFLATAMAISAIPVLAKVLLDLNLFRRKVGQTILAAAMIDDATGWVLLSVVIGLASGATLTAASVAGSVFVVVGFIVFMLTIGRYLIGLALARVGQHTGCEGRQLSLIAVIMLLAAAVSHALHIEALLGAFAVGMALSLCPRLSPSVVHSLEDIALRIFAPVFFAAAGLKVQLVALLIPGVWEYALLLLVVAIACKGIGVFFGATLLARVHPWEALFYGAGLNARGSMEIVVASIGLALGVLSQQMFSAIVMVAVVTSVMAPPLMRYALHRIPKDPDEETRLAREAASQQGIIANTHRVLVPVRARASGDLGPTHRMQALLLRQLAKKNKNISVTLFSVVNSNEDKSANIFLDHLGDLFSSVVRIQKRVVVSANAGDAILDEIRLGYDLVLMGTPETNKDANHTIFTPLIDYVLRLSPCATILIQGRENLDITNKMRRVLVPTNGSAASRRAAEVGFSLLGDMAEEMIILKVVEEEESGDERLIRRQVSFGRAMVAELESLAASLGVAASGRIAMGANPEELILAKAANDEVDLIILGTDVRVGAHRLYLGPRVERILERSLCPVIVVNG